MGLNENRNVLRDVLEKETCHTVTSSYLILSHIISSHLENTQRKIQIEILRFMQKNIKWEAIRNHIPTSVRMMRSFSYNPIDSEQSYHEAAIS